jgi:uncharacterized protein
MIGIRLTAMTWVTATLIALGAASAVRAQGDFQIDLQRPGDREFILDRANLISDADKQTIRTVAGKLLTDKAAPIVVVTIESMQKYGGGNLRIETFARLLFDQWGVGPEKVGDKTWNHGILLLVSRDDRKARIELGAGWQRDKDGVARQIMDQQILPHFKRGDFSGGIVAGVEALDRMARELELPKTAPAARPGTSPSPGASSPSGSPGFSLGGLILVGLAIFTIVSLFRMGSRGWAWLMWGAVFGLIGTVLYHLASASQNDSDSGFGGFSGGSFGGGFSGGGGATGDW